MSSVPPDLRDSASVEDPPGPRLRAQCHGYSLDETALCPESGGQESNDGDPTVPHASSLLHVFGLAHPLATTTDGRPLLRLPTHIRPYLESAPEHCYHHSWNNSLLPALHLDGHGTLGLASHECGRPDRGDSQQHGRLQAGSPVHLLRQGVLPEIRP